MYSVSFKHTNQDFLAASANFDPTDMDVDISGRSFMVTGANTGIGKAVTTEIARRGGTVHMMCIMLDEDTRKEIVEKTGNKNVHLHVLDLSKPKDVYQFAKQFVDSHNRLDVLVNNAGFISMNSHKTTEDGLEMTFAVNSLAPYILTTTLFPLLNKTPGSRVIMVASSAAFYMKADVHNLQKQLKPYNGMHNYSQTKRQLLIMTEMLALRNSKIQISSMYPGTVNTLFVEDSMPDFAAAMKRENQMRSPEQGADTIVWLSISESALRHDSGQFFIDRKVASSIISEHPEVESSEEEKQILMDNLDKTAKKMIGK